VLFTGLVAAGGDRSQVAAAVLIYRALTWALPLPVGIGCYVWWRRQSWPASQDALRAAQARRP
jgi:putative heme transporter